MAAFQLGETVVCSITVKDEDGTLQDTATSMEIQITDPGHTVSQAYTAMSNDSTGLYHYDYATASLTLKGKYRVDYKATDGSRISIQPDFFELEV